MAEPIYFAEGVTRERMIEHLQLGNAFSYNEKKGWAWLQRLCFRFLRWRGCQHRQTVTTFTRRRIDPDRVVEALFEQKCAVKEMLGRGGEVVIIGTEDYAQMMRESVLGSPLCFSARYNHGAGGHRTAMGLRVVVVPWISGMVVLPREIAKEIGG